LTAADKKAIDDKYNKLRRRVALGKENHAKGGATLSKAADMRKIVTVSSVLLDF